MSLQLPLENLLVNLEEDVDPAYLFIYVPREIALELLRDFTGQDFGSDAKRWREWLENAGLVPKRNIPAEQLRVLENDCPSGYIRLEGGRESAVKKLQEWTGQDFGDDAKKWREWLESNGLLGSETQTADRGG